MSEYTIINWRHYDIPWSVEKIEQQRRGVDLGGFSYYNADYRGAWDRGWRPTAIMLAGQGAYDLISSARDNYELPRPNAQVLKTPADTDREEAAAAALLRSQQAAAAAVIGPIVSCPPGKSIGFILTENSEYIEYQCGESSGANWPVRITPGPQSRPCPPGTMTIDIPGGLRYCRPPGTNAASNTARPGWGYEAYGATPPAWWVLEHRQLTAARASTGGGAAPVYAPPPPPISNYTPPPPPISNYTPPPPPISNYTSPPNYTPSSAVVSRIEEWTIFGFPGLYVVIGGIAGLFMFSNKKG